MSRPGAVDPTKRHSVPSHPGIYYRLKANGDRSYCFEYRPAIGASSKFKTVKGGLREAKAARIEMLGRINKGESVVRPKALFSEVADAYLAHQRQRLRPRSVERHELELR